jgi:intracellular multiplication protein IcmC
MKSLEQNSKITVLLFICLFLSGCTDENFPTIQQVLININTVIPDFWHLITGFSFVAGIAFIMRGILALKTYGEGRTMMSQQTSLKGPILLVVIGSALLFLPTTKAIMLQTAFGYSQQMPIGYNAQGSIFSPAATNALLRLVQLIGLVSFIRGWFYLAHLSNPSGGQSPFGKAMTHIVGGIMAINNQGTINLFQATIGIT